MHRLAAVAVGVVGGVVVAASAGCLDVEIPSEAQLRCASDTDCPAELICDDVTRFCVDRAAGGATSIEGATLTPRLLNRSTLANDGVAIVDVILEVAFDKAPRSLSSVSLATARGTVASFDDVATAERSDDRRTITLRGRVGEDVAAGEIDVVGTFVDDRGVAQEFRVANVGVVDFADPVVLGASMTRVIVGDAGTVANEIGDPGYPVSRLTDIQVTVVVDEALVLDGDDAPTLTLGDSGLTFVRRDDIDAPLIFSPQWPGTPEALAAIVDGDHALVLRITDLAGNTVEEAVIADGVGSAPAALHLTIDQTPPRAPAVDVDGAVVFERAPWGRLGGNGIDIYTVQGAAGSVDPDVVVVVSRDAEGQREIGRFRAENDGSFGGVARGLLATGDARVVYLRSWDRAGNASDVVAVRDIEWVASPANKIVGDTLVNPHSFESVATFLARRDVGDIVEHGGAAFADDDDVTVTTAGAGRFSRLSTQQQRLSSSSLLGALIDTAFGHDPVRGFSVLYGGRVTTQANSQGGSDRAGSVCTTQGTRDLFVRRDNGHWQAVGVDGSAASPPAMGGARFVFDTSRNELLLVGNDDDGALQLWHFDGARFVRRCLDAACVQSTAGISPSAVAFDLVEQTLVAVTSDGTRSFEDGAFVPRCVGDDCGAPATGALVYDEGRDAVVAVDPAAGTIARWDRAASSWVALCTDVACQASVPPVRAGASVVYDARQAQLVVFGGEDVDTAARCDYGSRLTARDSDGVVPLPSPANNDTFAFDGTQWRTIAGPEPPGRTRHAAGYDVERGVVVVAGGDECNCFAGGGAGTMTGLDDDTAHRDVWELDAQGWRQVEPTPAPDGFFPVAAPLTSDHRMTSDPARSAVLLYGEDANVDGLANVDDGIDSLYLFRDGTWLRAMRPDEANTLVGQQASNVSPLLSGLTTAADDTIFILGGTTDGAAQEGAPFASVVDGNRTRFACAPDPTCGRPTYPGNPNPAPLPFGAALGHDGTQLIVFGGVRRASAPAGFFSLSDGASDDVIGFSTATGFVDVCAGGVCGSRPPARYGALFATSPDDDGALLLFGGGLRFGNVDGRLWRFADGRFDVVASADAAIPGRVGHVLVFDPERRAVLMTMGTDENLSNDSRGLGRERVVDERLEQVWEWSDGAWSEADIVDVEGDGRPLARFATAAAADPRGGVVLHGGTPLRERVFSQPGGGTRLADTWRWRGGADERPMHRFTVRTRVAGVERDDVQGATLEWRGRGHDGDGNVVPVELLVWSGTAWRSLPTTTCGDGCTTATLSAALTRASTVGVGRELLVAAAPLAVNGLAPGRADLVTDAVELRLRARR